MISKLETILTTQLSVYTGEKITEITVCKSAIISNDPLNEYRKKKKKKSL